MAFESGGYREHVGVPVHQRLAAESLHDRDGGAADTHRPAEPQTATDRDRGAHPERALATGRGEGDPRRVVLVDLFRQLCVARRLVDETDMGVDVEGDPRASNPGPRLALDAGTRTITGSPGTTASE